MDQNYVKEGSSANSFRTKTWSWFLLSSHLHCKPFCLHKLPWWSSLILRQSTCTALPWPPATLATSRDNSLWHTHAFFSNLDTSWLTCEPTFCILNLWHGNSRYGFNSVTDEHTFSSNWKSIQIFFRNHFARITSQSKLLQWKEVLNAFSNI